MPSSRWMTALGCALILTASWSSARGDPKPKKDQKEAEASIHKTGKVRVVRGIGGGQPQLTDQGGKHWILTGPLKEELLNLSGHRISVWAEPGEKKKLMTATLVVQRYELLKKGGRTPQIGVLKRAAGKGILLRQKDRTLTIDGRPAFLRRLEEKLGCKVWLVGNIEGTTLKAFKYGKLSCKKKQTPIKSGKETQK